MKKFLFFAACACIISCNDEKKTSTATTDSDTAKTAMADDKAKDMNTAPAMPTDSAAMMKAWEAYMTPGEPHKMMAMSNGKWKEDMTMYMSPDAPPQKMTSSCENTMMMNGLYQKSVHKGMYNNMPFEGISTMAYNNASKKYQSTWIDNMGSGIMNMEGTYDEASKTINMKGMTTDPMSGQDMAVRETFKLIDDKNHYMEMFETRAGKESKTLEIKFTKQ